MPNNIAFLPTSVENVIQQGFLAPGIKDALMPLLGWRMLMFREQHNGGMMRQGESATKTRDALIQPSTDVDSLLAPGGIPKEVTRSVEQWTYQLKSRGNSLQINLPGSAFAQADRFMSDMKALSFQARHTLNRLARNVVFAAYGGGNSFAPAAGVTTATLVVADAAGFEKVVNAGGTEVDVSSANPGYLSIAGAAAVAYTAVNLTTNTITLSATASWLQYDSIVRSDAPRVVRANSRATDRLIVSGDTATMAVFREAAAYLRGHNVPGLDGTPTGDYGAFVDSDIENALYADTEFRDAVTGAGIAGSPEIQSGLIGRYAGIMFFRQPKSEMPIIASAAPYQTTIHKSLVFGSEICAEMYVPESTLLADANPASIISSAHTRVPIDEVITAVIRAPQDPLGRTLTASWVANVDYSCPTDSKALTGTQRHKRAVAVHTAGPA